MAEKDARAKKHEIDESGPDINTDENVSGTSHLNEPMGDSSEVEKLKSDLEEMKDKYLRLVAEFDNFN